MTRKSILHINSLSNNIIKIQNEINLLVEQLSKDVNYIHYNKELDNYGYYGHRLSVDEMSEIVTHMKSHESESNSDIYVKIEHATENTDPWEDYELDVTNITIYADVSFSEKEIEDAKNIKLAKIEELEVDMKRLEEELKGLMKDEN